MSMTTVEKMQLKNAVERVLHVQGNYQGGILEMAIVFDMSMPKEEAAELAKELVATLKTQSEIFRNVRLNTILWRGEDDFVKEVTALPVLQMGQFFSEYESRGLLKNWDGLLALLKKFYARSKLILVITNQEFKMGEKAEVKESLQPFLHRKMLVMQERKIIKGTDLLMEAMR